jgi:hypothetical protein
MFARYNQGRAAARDQAAMRSPRLPARLWRLLPFSLAVAAAAACALPQSAFGAVAAPGITFTNLTLLNGWGAYSSDTATPAVAVISGVVYFKGAISTSDSNTNNVAFVLPLGFRPSKFVNVPVDMCDSARGELYIAPNGTTQVISAGANTDATCFTSLDGASFTLSTRGFTAFKLQRKWTEFGSFYRKAAGRVIGGVVHLAGEIQAHGNNATAFTLPAAFRPATNVNVLINVCTGSIGRLHITTKGVVTVRSQEGWWAIKCGVSLDGATYVLSPKSFKALTLKNGWTNAPGTAKASVRNHSGIVRFRGAIRTSGSNSDPFILPAAFRPAKDVYIPVDLCNGDTGRLDIQPDGTVAVQALSNFSAAQCLTSLDGAWYER